MAGHPRTIPAPGARRTGPGRTRKNREHLPAGETDANRREKDAAAVRRIAYQRIRAANGPAEQIDAARAAFRSANAKYSATSEHTDAAVEALLAAAVAVIRGGTRRPAAQRKRKE